LILRLQRGVYGRQQRVVRNQLLFNFLIWVQSIFTIRIFLPVVGRYSVLWACTSLITSPRSFSWFWSRSNVQFFVEFDLLSAFGFLQKKGMFGLHNLSRLCY
jgi:hypothetical protein